MPDKQADLLLLTTDSMNLTPVNNSLAAIGSQANPSHIDSGFVAGEAVKRNGRLLNPYLATVQERARKPVGDLVEKALLINGVQL